MSDESIPPKPPPSSEPPPPPPSEPPPPPPPSEPPPAKHTSAGGSDNTLMLVLAYLGILSLIPLLVEKEDPEVQWHAKNGLLLFLAEFVFFAVINFVPLVGCLISGLAIIGVLVLHIVAIIKATKGERLIIPVISDYVEKI